MTSQFLGKGWSFPIRVDLTGQITMTQAEENIRQSIWMILSTARGERVMRPDFGCGIHNLVFAVNSAGTAGRVKTEVSQALIQWEPRINIININTVLDATQPNRLLIEIEYEVRTTNNRFNLVYPFYLE
jgi:phage baseplate assembly protein W